MKRGQDRRGFTIVELLIVIVVIGILAVITVAAYSNMQQRARVSAATSSVTQAKKKLEVFKVDNGGYPLTGSLASAGITDTSSTTYQYTSNGTTYCLTGTVGNVSYKVSDSTQAASGGCAGHGQGGVAAVTNLATNPGFEVNSGWHSNNGSINPRSVSTTVKRTGGYAVEAHNLSDSVGLLSLYGAGANSGEGFAVEPNKTYTIAVYVRADVPFQARLSVTYRVSGTYASTTYSTWTQGVSGEWLRLSVTMTSPAGADMVRPGVFINAMTTQPAGTSGWADDLMFVEGSTIPGYADGTFTDWIWNGTPHYSTSTGPAL